MKVRVELWQICFEYDIALTPDRASLVPGCRGIRDTIHTAYA